MLLFKSQKSLASVEDEDYKNTILITQGVISVILYTNNY